MLHAMFQDNRTSGSGEDGHGGHLGHVTKTILQNSYSLFPRRLHIIVGFDWPSGLRGKDI